MLASITFDLTFTVEANEDGWRIISVEPLPVPVDNFAFVVEDGDERTPGDEDEYAALEAATDAVQREGSLHAATYVAQWLRENPA